MRLCRLTIAGAFVVEPDVHVDERGSFLRTFCAREFAAAGLDARVAQTSLALNRRAGTLRGLHYVASPSTEAKLVRCVRGRAFDVLVDLRPNEPTFRSWISMELSPDGGQAVFIPPGVAHGYLTLEDETDLLYQMTDPHDPEAARGVRYDDPAFGIAWPFAPTTMCGRDRSYPDTAPA